MERFGEIVIGHAGCQLSDIISVLNESTELEQLRSQYEILLRHLDLQPSSIEPFMQLIQWYEPINALKCILKKWVKKSKNDATVNKLVRVFNSLRLYYTASLLNRSFILSPKKALLLRKQSGSNTIAYDEVFVVEETNNSPSFCDLTDNETTFMYEPKYEGKAYNRREQVPLLSFPRSDKSGLRKDSSCSTTRAGSSLEDNYDEVEKQCTSVDKPDKINNRNLKVVYLCGCVQICVFLTVQATLFLGIPLSWKFGSPANPPEGPQNNPTAPNWNQDYFAISASSYIQFQRQIRYKPANAPVEASIDIKLAENWPNGVSLQNAHQITKLTISGISHRFKLLSILQEAVNIVELQLVGDDEPKGSCDFMGNGVYEQNLELQPVKLDNLRVLKFSNFSHCSPIYNFLKTYFAITQLHKFYLVNGIVDTGNVDHIIKILKDNKSSVKSLHFINSKLNILLFQKMPELSSVDELEIDALFDLPIMMDKIGSRFQEIYPRLTRFISKRGHFIWGTVDLLFNFSKLTYLIVGIKVPGEVDQLSMSFMRNSKPSLKHVQISFNFPNKQSNDSCIIIGKKEESERFSRLDVQGNCQVKFVPYPN